jgi:hypothetical protein
LTKSTTTSVFHTTVASTATATVTGTSTTVDLEISQAPAKGTTTTLYQTITSKTITVTTLATQTSTTLYTPLCGPTPTFALQVATVAASGEYSGQYLTEGEANRFQGSFGIYPQSDILQAAKFYISSGSLFDSDGRVFVNFGSSNEQQAIFYPVSASWSAVTGCAVTNGVFSCVQGGSTAFWFYKYDDQQVDWRLMWGPPSANDGDPSSGDSKILTLNVIQLCHT